MATHSSTLAWKIPWMEEPGRLQSMGSRRVGHLLSDFTFTFMHWRRKWQRTPVFLPGESQGRGRLVGCHLWGRTESDTTEATQQQHSLQPNKLLLLSHFSRVQLCAVPQMAAHQGPPSLGFSRQEHWSGLPFPSPMHESESEVAQ